MKMGFESLPGRESGDRIAGRQKATNAQRKKSWAGAHNLALWERKLNLEARVDCDIRAKTVLGKTAQEEMELGCS